MNVINFIGMAVGIRVRQCCLRWARLLFVDNSRCCLSFREWMRCFHDLLTENLLSLPLTYASS
jgi:hypothetical protein